MPFRCLAVAALAGVAITGPVRAERPIMADELPAEMKGVGIVERLDERLPLELTFTDETGATVALGDYFAPGRPVILTFNYYRCPMLCTLTLNGMVDALNDVDWTAGAEFEIVTLSIAPNEGPDLALVKKKAYLTQYDRDDAGAGWHFLTGNQDNIEALATAAGFGYRFDERSGDYAHTSSIIFVTPDGRLSRYMNDVVFESRDVRLALVEASRGAIGTPMEKFLLFTCFQYDPEANSYAVSAMKIVRLTGAMTVLLIVGGLVVLWLRGTDDRPVPADGGLATP